MQTVDFAVTILIPARWPALGHARSTPCAIKPLLSYVLGIELSSVDRLTTPECHRTPSFFRFLADHTRQPLISLEGRSRVAIDLGWTRPGGREEGCIDHDFNWTATENRRSGPCSGERSSLEYRTCS